MLESSDWTLLTWAGNRLAQHREFQALPFRDKLLRLEHLGQVTEFFAQRAIMRAPAVKETAAAYREDVSPEFAELQARRYRVMTAAEKLACADALWELAWDATKAGVRMRHPEFDEEQVTYATRQKFDCAPN